MNKKLYIPIALFLALSVVGVGMAYWTDALYIDGSITTATWGGHFSHPLIDRYIEYEWKDIGWIEAWIDADADPDWKHFVIQIGNAYPGYKACAGVGIEWEGELPAHIDEIIIVAPPELLVTVVPYDGQPPLEETQLHLGDEYFFHICVEVIEDDDANPIIDPEQLGEYVFTVTFKLCQWNDPFQ